MPGLPTRGSMTSTSCSSRATTPAERIARDTVHVPIEAVGEVDAAAVLEAINAWVGVLASACTSGRSRGSRQRAGATRPSVAPCNWRCSRARAGRRPSTRSTSATARSPDGPTWPSTCSARVPRGRVRAKTRRCCGSSATPTASRAASPIATRSCSPGRTCSRRSWPSGRRPCVVPLHQATDPDRFRPEPQGPRHELLFVGSSRGVRRRILADLAGTTHEVAVYGGGWTDELLAPHRLAGEWIANDELRRWYSSAGIVLCYDYDDMRDEGFISNRAYDALASGAFVISDRVPWIEAEFGAGLVTYGDPAELHGLVERYLDDPERRRREAAIGRATVLARHTFAHRAKTILDEVARLPGAPAAGDRA